MKSAIIQILKPLGKLDNLAGAVPWKIAVLQPEVLIAKVVCVILGMIADFLLISLVSTGQTIKYTIKKPPDWDDPFGAKATRKTALNNRIKRSIAEVKIDYLKEYGSDEAIDNYLKKIRKD